jgi:predicted SprT family Zn-dependent metalloprotease
MTLHQAKHKARELMNQHGLSEWKFEFDRAKRRYGLCSYSRKTISLSAHLVPLNSDEETIDTILHEIAHALSWIKYNHRGHGAIWKMVCRQIGARPERCYSSAKVSQPKPKYLLIHKETKEVFARYYKAPKYLRDSSKIFIRSKKEATIGKLIVVPNH